MMDKGQHYARVWQSPSTILQTPKLPPFQPFPNRIRMVHPLWTTVPTRSNHGLPNFTIQNHVRSCRLNRLTRLTSYRSGGSGWRHGGSQWRTVGGVAIENTLWLCCICVVKIQHHFRWLTALTFCAIIKLCVSSFHRPHTSTVPSEHTCVILKR